MVTESTLGGSKGRWQLKTIQRTTGNLAVLSVGGLGLLRGEHINWIQDQYQMVIAENTH